MTAPYQPVACALHSELEAAALLGATVELHGITEAGKPQIWCGRVLDIYASGGAEYLALAAVGGERLTLRLDRVRALNPVPAPR